MVKKAYKEQRHRGYEGFGFYTPDNNRLTHNTGERNILRLLKNTRQSEILFHHRFPTSTENVRNACHPFSTKNRWKSQYVGVHNGVIWNDFEVAEQQIKDGIRYVSFQPDGTYNDSEVLLYDIAQYIEGEKSWLDCEGNIAFIIIKRDKKGNKEALYFGRNEGNPLKLVKYEDGFRLSSEGTGQNIEPNRLFKYDYKTGQFTSEPLEIPYYKKPSTSYSGNYMGYGYGYDWGQGSKATTVAGDSTSLMVETTLERNIDYMTFGLTDETVEIVESQIVDEVISALRYDTYEQGDRAALDFGTEVLDELQGKYMILENRMVDDGLDDIELDECMELDNKITILSKALDKLNDNQLKLALGGVRYLPDSGRTY